MKNFILLLLCFFISKTLSSQVFRMYKPGIKSITEKVYKGAVLEENLTENSTTYFYENGIIKGRDGLHPFKHEVIDSSLYYLKFDIKDCGTLYSIETRDQRFVVDMLKSGSIESDKILCKSSEMTSAPEWEFYDVLPDSLINIHKLVIDKQGLVTRYVWIFNENDKGYIRLLYEDFREKLLLVSYTSVQKDRDRYVEKNFAKKRYQKDFALVTLKYLDLELRNSMQINPNGISAEILKKRTRNSTYEYNDRNDWIKSSTYFNNSLEIKVRDIVYYK